MKRCYEPDRELDPNLDLSFAILVSISEVVLPALHSRMVFLSIFYEMGNILHRHLGIMG